MSRNLNDISFDIIENNKDISPSYRRNADMQVTIKKLLVALHDAINSPKGVVPKSADDFYSHRYYTESFNSTEQ